MDDLISRQAAIDALVKAIREDPYYDSDGAGLSVCDVRVILSELPSAQPEPKTGKWIDAMVGEMPIQVCDQCNTFFPLAYTGGGHHFCPNCGAKMEVEHE